MRAFPFIFIAAMLSNLTACVQSSPNDSNTKSSPAGVKGPVVSVESDKANSVADLDDIEIDYSQRQLVKFLNSRKQQLDLYLARQRELSAERRNVLQAELNAVESSLGDRESAHARAVKLFRETMVELELLQGRFPLGLIGAAQTALTRGDDSMATVLFQKYLKAKGNQPALAGRAAFRAGRLAENRIDFTKAYAFYQVAIASRPDNPKYLNDAAYMAQRLSRFAEAETYYLRALAILEESYGEQQAAIATVLNGLAATYEIQQRYDAAEPKYLRVLDIKTKIFGPDHPELAGALKNLAVVYEIQRRLDKAESYHLRALAIQQRAFGPDHPEVAATKVNLALFYLQQNRPEKAKPIAEEAERVFRMEFGPAHPKTDASRKLLMLIERATRS